MNNRFEVLQHVSHVRQEIPLFLAKIPAGFPSPAEDYLDKKLDLNNYLIKNPAATFFIRVKGNSMVNAGIRTGDLLIVDRSLEPKDKKIVIACLNGEFTIKRIQKVGEKLYLAPENDSFTPIEIKEEMDFEIWGIVTSVIHTV
jgi:DNA polymerase V